MNVRMDHVVVLVPELEAAVAGYGAAGFTVTRGGRHAAGSTHNALVAFDDGSYLELIAFLRNDPTHRWHRAAQLGRWGFVDFALGPDSAEAAVAAARAAGLAYRDPVEGGRVRPDGERLRWQVAVPPTPDLPFFCADLTPRVLRVPSGAACRHRNGVTGVAGLTLGVRDLRATETRWAALTGTSAPWRVRDCAVSLQPRTAQEDGVVELALGVPGAPTASAPMPLHLTQGAALRRVHLGA